MDDSGSAAAAEFRPLLEPTLTEYSKFYEPPSLPFRLAPFEYAGLGAFPLSPKPADPNLLQFEPTLPTMTVEAVRDLITGEVIDYVDLPISTDRGDPGLNRPIVNVDGYVRADRGVPFNPDGKSMGKVGEDLDLKAFVEAVETGTFLLSSPFQNESMSTSGLEPLPELPAVEPTQVNNPWERGDAEVTDTCSAVIDEWDPSRFESEVPNPAFKFEFELDAFQKRAIYRLERSEPVFVAAPTSAGKTVVAQYAISLSRSHKMRAIYTSPIKALSNQKYRDFTRVFGDVGILTGDVSLNREASTLIMTTEILRSMLYHGVDVLRDVETVIFDECHYISDPERGVVWEESIIMMPPHITMVFLSATAPNDLEIASWIARTRRQPVFVERHLERPVPLVHKLYSTAGLFRLGDSKSLDEGSYQQVRESLTGKDAGFQPRFWMDLVRALMREDLLPALIFFFSQKSCDKFSDSIRGHLTLLDAKQRARVHDFCREAITRLSPEDRTLPQVERVIGLAEAGIGVHHGGMLPILKEVVEMLLADGLLKVLFCTSTFAMGINVPARTCCFAALRKFNGKEFVLLTPTEYVQMSGRAGRRGLDKVGTSIIICSKEIPEPDYLRQLLRGQGEALESQFRLRPNMILGLIRVQGIRMVDLLRRTLSANSVEAKIPEKLKELGEIEEALARFPKVDCVMGDIEEAIVPFAEKAGRMIEIMKRLDLGGEMKEAVAVGRIVLIIAQTIDVAVILHIATLRKISVRTAEGSPIMICADNICGFFDATLPDANSMAAPEIKRVLTPYRRRLPLRLSSVFKKVDPATLAGPSEEFAGLLREIWASPCYDCAQRDVHYGQARHRAEMEAKCKRLRNECASGQDAFLPLLNKHVQMLEQLHCISDGVITLKGRLALEMTTTAHELICAELILGNVFDDLAPDQLAGLTSCLLIEKAPKANEERVEVPESLQEQAEDIFAVVQEVADQMDECGIEFDEDTWSDTHFNPMGLRATMSWVNLRDFQTCVSQSSMTEGQLFRLLTSTATQLSCFAKAAMLIGNKGLADKFEETSTAMKRGIIFTPSLYLD